MELRSISLPLMPGILFWEKYPGMAFGLVVLPETPISGGTWIINPPVGKS